MPKFKPTFYKPEDMNTENHCFLGMVWPVEGSKGNTYEVELHPKGFDCSCPGFGFRGKCKHTVAVARRLLGPAPKYIWSPAGTE